MWRKRLFVVVGVTGGLAGLVLLGLLAHPFTRGMLLTNVGPRAQVTRLEYLEAFRDAFNDRTDATRVVAWLSPT